MKVSDEKLQELQNVVFDHYLDYVANQRVDEFLETLPPDDAEPSFEPSDEFMKNMQKIMDDTEKKRRKSRNRYRFIKFVAGIAVIISVGGVASVSVEAFRVPMFQFFVKNEEKYNQVDLKDPGSSEYEKEQAANKQEEFPGLALPRFIPEGYTYESTKVIGDEYSTKYLKDDNIIFVYQYLNKSGNFADGEDVKTKIEEIDGIQLHITEKGENIKIIWKKDNNVYNLVGDISKDEALKVVNSMVYTQN